MLTEVRGSQPSGLLAAKKRENHGSPRLWLRRQSSRQFQDSSRPGSIIIGTVVDIVAIHWRSDPKMVEMRGQKNRCMPLRGIRPVDFAYCIPRKDLLPSPDRSSAGDRKTWD